MKEQPLHIGIQQRVLPVYRVPFFDKLAENYLGKVSVFYGLPRNHEMLETNAVPQIALHVRGRNLHLFSGQFYLCWQFGFMQWLQSWQPDVLIMEANPRYPSSRCAIRWMKAHHRKVIGWGLGSPTSQGFLGKLRMNQRRKFIHQFDALITYSQQGAKEYSALGFPKGRIFVAPNAAARQANHYTPRTTFEVRIQPTADTFCGQAAGTQAGGCVDRGLRKTATRVTTQPAYCWGWPSEECIGAIGTQSLPQHEILWCHAW